MRQRISDKQPRTKAEKREQMILWLLIILHTAALFILADFSRKPISYPDEMVYYDAAKSIHDGTEIMIHEMGNPYTNLAYPLLLAPLMGISNTLVRVRVIALLNSFLMSLILWPVWQICKDLGIRRKYAWIITIIFAIWPDMISAGTFMSENLYWPLAAFALWTGLRSINRKKPGWAIASGILCYLTYFSKEIGICFPLAYVVMQIADPFFEAISERKAEGRQGFFRQWIRKTDWKSIGLFCLFCAGLYLIINKWILGPVGNTYTNVLNAVSLSDGYSVLYLIYNMLSYFCAVCMAFFFLPVIVPVFHYSEMEKTARRGYLFGMILLLGMIVSVSYTIGMMEDLGKEQIRIHLRYFTPIIMILLPAFMAMITDDNLIESSVRTRRSGMVWACVALYMAIHCLLMKVPVQGAVNEHPGLGILRYLDYRLGDLTGTTGGGYPFHLGLIAMNALLAGAMFIGWLIFRSNKTRRFSTAFFFLAVILLCIGNTCWGISQLRLHYAVADSMRNEMAAINDYFQTEERKNGNVLYVCDNWVSDDPKTYDMYLDAGREYVTTWGDIYLLRNTSEGQEVTLSETELRDSLFRVPYIADRIDYLVEKKDNLELSDYLDGIEKIEIPEADIMFSVYRNTDPTNLVIISDKKDLKCLQTIEFRANNFYNASDYVKSGISVPENQYSWTEGHELNMEIPVDTAADTVTVVMNVFDTYHGEQRYTVTSGGEEAVSSAQAGTGQIEFSAAVTDGKCCFTVSLPDAVSPASFGESGDGRVLALAITRITVYENKTE